MKTAYIAIIAVVVIAAAGVGAYFILNNNDSGAGEDGAIRTDLKVGDSIVYEAGGKSTRTDTKDNQTLNFFLAALYPETILGEVVSQETINFKGVDYVCDVYKLSLGDAYNITKVVQLSKAVLYSESNYGFSMTSELIDTNLDISKNVAEQAVVDGSFIKLSQAMSLESSIKAVSDTTYTAKNVKDNTCTVTETAELHGSGSVEYKIKRIDAGIVTLEDGKSMKADEYLSYLSYTKRIEEYKAEGATIEYGKKTSEKIDTPLGKRAVTAQVLKISENGGLTQELTVYFGSNDAIYRIVQSGIELNLKSTTLFS